MAKKRKQLYALFPIFLLNDHGQYIVVGWERRKV